MESIFDIFLLEALISGLLFGGVLALLSLGLNLIFGVVDVIWICYAELVMFGMYAIYWLHAVYGIPLLVAAPMAILFVAALGFLVHYFVISPILEQPPINQLLATGGLLFFLQSFATLLWGVEFRNIHRLYRDFFVTNVKYLPCTSPTDEYRTLFTLSGHKFLI